MQTTTDELTTSINQLLKHAFGDRTSSKVCRDALLAACEPGRYPLEYGDLFDLDGDNTNAALNILTYRLRTMDSIERLIGHEELQRLRENWSQDHETD